MKLSGLHRQASTRAFAGTGTLEATVLVQPTSGELPKVRYNSLALILEANEAATSFFGRRLVGHHWQEFVTAGSTEEVSVMLEILAEAGAAESRFRMPRGDGSLIEFDSYTVADDGEFSTVFRPVPEPARPPDPTYGSLTESVR